MASATARAPQPNKRKGRAVAAARPLLNLHQLSTTTDNTAALRLQRLLDMGVAANRAALLASMAWEVQRG